MNNRLHNFTRAMSAGVALFRSSVRRLLPNLYIINQEDVDEESTPLIYSGDYPHINPHAYGNYLNLLGEMFDLDRNIGESDDEFRTRILFFISENATTNGITRSIQQIFKVNQVDVDVEVRENHRNFFDGTSTSMDSPLRSHRFSLLYGLTVVITPRVEERVSSTMLNLSTLQKETSNFPLGTVWRVRRNPYTGSIINSFKIDSLRYLIDDIAAAGIRVDSVVVKGFGTGGAAAPIKFIEKPVGYATGSIGEIPDDALVYDGELLLYDEEYLVIT